jgi:hypothetical protein
MAGAQLDDAAYDDTGSCGSGEYGGFRDGADGDDDGDDESGKCVRLHDLHSLFVCMQLYSALATCCETVRFVPLNSVINHCQGKRGRRIRVVWELRGKCDWNFPLQW